MSDTETPTKTFFITCMMCNTEHEITVPFVGYARWMKGTLIQNAMPELSADDRELLISQTCGSCYDKMFAEDES